MSRTRRTSRARLTAALLVPLAGLASSTASADAEQVPPGPQSIESACAGVPRDAQPFTDVDGNQFESAILCIAQANVARGGAEGAPADRYVPEGQVRRDAMAGFVVRLMDLADRLDTGEQVRALPPYGGSPAFSDVDGTTHEAAIGRLAEAGVVQGAAAGARSDRYVPEGTVTRAQMASFLDRALEHLLGQPVSTTDDYYTDDRGDVHEQSINDISSVGIAAGRSAGSYLPLTTVRRDTMAGFLARTFAELVERGAVRPLPPPLAVTPDDTTPGRLSFRNPDRGLTNDDRSYQVRGLVPGREYRVTVVDAKSTTRRADGQTVFMRDGDTGLASVGPRRSADLTSVDGAAPRDNAGQGSALTPTDPADTGTAVFIAGASGTAGFVLDLDDPGNELVLPVVHRNGGGDSSPDDGGSSPRLELGPDGVPIEPYDVGGAFRSE